MQTHIGIIPDGNRRYGKKNNLALSDAYSIAVDKLVEITNGIDHLFDHITVFLLSSDNIQKRSKFEIDCLFNVIDNFNWKSFQTNRKIIIIGSNEGLPQYIIDKKNTIHKENEQKKTNKYMYLLFNYSTVMDINQTLLNNNIKSYDELRTKMLANIPDFSMVFRSGDAPRMSTFPLLALNYCNMYFAREMWPEVQLSQILDYIENDKEQRFGK